MYYGPRLVLYRAVAPYLAFAHDDGCEAQGVYDRSISFAYVRTFLGDRLHFDPPTSFEGNLHDAGL